MSTSRPFKIFGRFPSGLNTIKKDGLSLAPEELAKAINVDIDDDGYVSRRAGISPLLSGAYRWLSNIDEDNCLAVCDGSLVQIKDDISGHDVILEGVSFDARMSYVKILDRIYYTNESIIGFVQNRNNFSLSTSGKPFKDEMSPGKFLEHFRARMWVAVGNQLIFSEVGNYGVRDLRVAPKQFPRPITMVKAVKDGMFIGAGSIYFMTIDDPLEIKPDALRRVALYDAISYLVSNVDGDSIVDGKTISGNVFFFGTEQGICLGADGGEFVNLTSQKYKMISGKEGAAIFVTNEKGTSQVIMNIAK